MKKAKKITLKTVHKNVWTIGAIISIVIGAFKELMNAFAAYSKKATEVIASIPKPAEDSVRHLEHVTRAPIHNHSGFEGLLFQMKIWVMHHWNIVLIVAGIMLIFFIIFLVDEIKDKIEEAKK